EDEGVVRYGTSSTVPSRLDEPDAGPATVVLVATDWPADVERALAGLRAHAPAGTTVLVVADGPSDEQAAALPVDVPDEVEVVRPSERLGTGAAWNIGLRRALGRVVVIVDASIEPAGDLVTPLVAALDDPSVAVAGGFGLVSADLRRFEEADPGDATAIEA